MPRLTKNRLASWYGKYNKDKGNQEDIKCEKRILSSVGKVNNFRDFEGLLHNPADGILKWKGAFRTIRYYDCLDKDATKWMELFQIIKNAQRQPKETVKKIVSFSRQNMRYKAKGSSRIYSGGISYPVASTIVYFFSDGKCPIIDWRAVYTLVRNGYGSQLKRIYLYRRTQSKSYQISLDDDAWDDYFDLCYKIVADLQITAKGNDTPVRVLDKALWWYPEESKKHLQRAHH